MLVNHPCLLFGMVIRILGGQRDVNNEPGQVILSMPIRRDASRPSETSEARRVRFWERRKGNGRCGRSKRVDAASSSLQEKSAALCALAVENYLGIL